MEAGTIESVRKPVSWNRKHISPETKEYIIELYENGNSGREVARIVGISRDIIEDRLDEWGVKRRTNRFATNHDAFAELTEESLYYIGFIFGDGCVTYDKRDDRCALSITSNDIDIAQKFRQFIGDERRAISKDERGRHTVAVYSTKIVNDLRKYGIVPRKSLTARVETDKIWSSRDWARGLIDADGSLSRAKGKPCIYLGSGSYNLVFAYTRFLRMHEVRGKNPIYQYFPNQRDNPFFVFKSLNQLAVDTIRLLYEDAQVYLDRKYATAVNLIREWEERR